jgi:dTDP-glucose 4,6-dehydratase
LSPQCLGREAPPYIRDGKQIRDWLYVVDHCKAIQRVLASGQPGEVYNIGGWNEKTNVEVVQTLCALLDEVKPRLTAKSIPIK